MKRAGLYVGLLCACPLLTAPAQGQALIYEPFDYALGGASSLPINTLNGGTGFAGPWDNTRNNPVVVEPGLGYGSLVTTGGAAQGNAWSALVRPIGTTLSSAGLMNNGASLWFSAIMDMTGQNFINADINIALGSAAKFVSDEYSDRENFDGAASEGIGITHYRGNVRGVYWQDEGDLDTVSERTTANSSFSMDANNGPLSAYIVGRIDWGADANANETLTLFAPSTQLDQGLAILSAMSIPAMDQSQFTNLLVQFKDTPKVDEIRFGATYEDVAVLPDPLTLRVDTVTGETMLVGDDDLDVDINYYQITSSGNSLNPAGWSSLADQDFDGNGPPNGSGDGWEEGGGSGTHALAEAYLLGNSTIAANATVGLGNGYNTAIDARDLVFNYRSATGARLDGIVEYVQSNTPGDLDGDGDVDGVDLSQLFSAFTGPGGGPPANPLADLDNDGDVDGVDIALAFGAFTGPLSPANVPEPSSLLLLLAGSACLNHRRRPLPQSAEPREDV